MLATGQRVRGVPMAYVVVREIDRADPAVMAGLRDAGVATVHEAAGRSGLLGPQIRPLQAGARIACLARPSPCPVTPATT